MRTWEEKVDKPLLQLDNILTGYGTIPVLHGIDLTLAEGDIYALLGPNGGGKSTLLTVCSRQIEPWKGNVKVAGRSMEGVAPEELAKVGVCTIPEGKGIFPNLTVSENLVMMTHSGTDLATIESITYDRFPQLSNKRKQLAGTLSGGEQQMLSMARALGTNPKILLLDELSMGLAPIIVKELYEIVAQLAEQGIGVLVVEQFARTVLGVATRAGILINGKIISEGSPNELEDQLSDAYLGTKGKI
jgi:branched-chain amino acid transport system ATP-binding protein